MMKTNWDDLMSREPEDPEETFDDDDVSNVRVIPGNQKPLIQDWPKESQSEPEMVEVSLEDLMEVALEELPVEPVEHAVEASLEDLGVMQRKRDLMRKLHPSNTSLSPAQKVKLEATVQAMKHANAALDELELALDWVHVFDPVSDWQELHRELTKLVSTLEYRRSVI